MNRRHLLALPKIALFATTANAALIGHWEFEETSGDTANDSSGTNNHGLVSFEFGGLGENFSVWLDDPVRGRVISFDGSIPGTYVEFALDTIPVMDFDNDFTWAFWALDLSSGPNHVILGNRYDGFGADFAPREFIKFTPTQFEFHHDAGGADNLNYDDIPNGVWHHHTVVKEGDLLLYYFDGVEAGSQFIAGTTLNPQPLFLGGDNNTAATGEYWTGYLDDVRIYDEALTAEVVSDFVPNPPPTFFQSVYYRGESPANTPFSADFSTEASDPLGQTLTFSKTSGPEWLTVSPAGALGGTPTDADTGLATLVLEATDGANPVTATVYLVVTPAGGSLPPLLGAWDFEETSGDTATDSSGNGNDGLVDLSDSGGLDPSGSVWTNDPERNRVISFNGDGLNSAHVETGNLIPVMTLDNNFTWSLFSKNFEEATIDGVVNNGIILGNRTDEFGTDFSPREFIKFTSVQFEWHENATGSGNLNYEDVQLDVWVHHTLVKIGSLLVYYRDGVEVSYRTITAGLNNPQPLNFGGGFNNGAGEFWGGYLDNVRIFDGALTADQALALSREGSGPVEPERDPSFKITALSLAPGNNQTTITFASEAGKSYTIQRSTTLTAAGTPDGWVTVENSFVASADSSNFTDSIPVAAGTRELYYRVTTTD